jgi:superfamily II DNA/RNA helicase
MELSAKLLEGIYSNGFKYPTNIQSYAIPAINTGESVIAQAPSGTGKTGSYGIGMLNQVDPSKNTTQALILVHTRDLAMQIYDVIKTLSKYMGITIELFRGGGGDTKELQQKALKRPHVVVSTPGIAKSFIESGHLRLEDVRCIVMDEADMLFGDDFRDVILSMFSFLPEEGCQLLIFSATFPRHIIEIINNIPLRFYTILKAEKELTLKTISQYYVDVTRNEYKEATLLDLYGKLHIQKSIIFCNHKTTVEELERTFRRQNFETLYISSTMDQQTRDDVMKRFRTTAAKILISTDVTSRGIDVQKVTLVINFDMPKERETYIHRIGRSGRNTKKGLAINFVTSAEVKLIHDLEHTYATKIPALPDDVNSILKKIEAFNNNE